MRTAATRSGLVGALTAAAGLMAGCLGDGAPTEVAARIEAAPSSQVTDGGRGPEEEIFGRVLTTDSSGWMAYLSPAANLPTGATDSVPVGFGNHDYTWDWGWFDITGNDPQCVPGPGYGSEIHRLPNGTQTPSTVETHCIAMGTSFTLDLKRNDTLQLRREIDWVAWIRLVVGDDNLYIDDAVGDTTHYHDVIAHFDQTGGTDTVAPVVQVTATMSTREASWNALTPAADTSYHIPANFTVRLGAWPTTSTAPINTVLVRYFWNHGSTVERTGFFSLGGLSDLGLARTHRYGLDTIAPNHTIRAHFVLPHQVPSPVDDVTSTDYGKTLDLSLHIEDSLTAVIAAEDTVVIGDTVHFADPGQDGGGLLGRLWTFGDGDSDTTATPAHPYATAGTKTVILTKTHAHHGLQVADTATVVVLPPLAVGPIVGSYAGWPTNNDIEENGDCMWEVTPTGGTGSYSYVWQRQKRFWATITGETTQELYLADVGTSDFGLRTIISSGPLTDTTAALSMTVSPKGQVCIIRK